MMTTLHTVETHVERDIKKSLVVIKCIVMIGIIASYFVPQEYVIHVGIASNLLWLWKT